VHNLGQVLHKAFHRDIAEQDGGALPITVHRENPGSTRQDVREIRDPNELGEPDDQAVFIRPFHPVNTGRLGNDGARRIRCRSIQVIDDDERPLAILGPPRSSKVSAAG
jgi:hypothetical protein